MTAGGGAGHVVVVGGGPVGLSAALLLGRAGIRCTMLERDVRTSTHPKARGVRPRTMELFTAWGLADDLWAHALPVEANRFIYCDSLAGAEIARTPESDGRHDDVSPIGPCRVAQDTVQRVLRRAVADQAGVIVRAGETVVAVADHGDRVAVRTATGTCIEGDYLIAADGVGSTVRQLLDVPLDGDPVLGYGQSIYWLGDLGRWTAHRPCIQFHTGQRTGHPASIATVDGRERWVTMVMQPPGAARPVPPTPAEATEIIGRAVGADVRPRIVDIATWRISAQVARTWRIGRCFLAGDAAHSFPPTGGFGMNTGVQDVHNLVWKIRQVLAGAADDRLLDTYPVERIEVARSNARWSVANGARFRQIGISIAAGDRDGLAQLLESQRAHVDATDQDLGFGYAAGALALGIESGGSPLRVFTTGHRVPAVPVWVAGQERWSVTGLDGQFTLLTADPSAWSGAAALRPEVVVAVCPAEPLGRAGVALVRPDGIVGWLGGAVATIADVRRALDTILGRTP